MKPFYVYGRNAYCSELDLFRAEHVTANECVIIAAPSDTTELYRVERSDFPELITHDWNAAVEVLQEELKNNEPYGQLLSVNVRR
jgi:hypothetical protein